MMRIDLTDTERKVITNEKTNISNSYKRNIHMHTRRKAARMIENLKFLADNLPESQQKQIFTPETVSKLLEKILKYRKPPKLDPEKIPRIRGSKYQHPTEIEAKYLHDIYVPHPKPHAQWPKRLPRWVYKSIKDSMPPERQKINGKKQLIGFGGPRYPHPSFGRQLRITANLVETTYDQIIEKVDPKSYRRKMIYDLNPIIHFCSKNQKMKLHSKTSWIGETIKNSLYDDWSLESINEWLKTGDAQKEKNLNSKAQEELLLFVKHWMNNFTRKANILSNQKILIIQGTKNSTMQQKEKHSLNNSKHIS